MKLFLVDFLDNKNIINPTQFGFQKGKSTQHALLRFSNMVYDALNFANKTEQNNNVISNDAGNRWQSILHQNDTKKFS